MAVLVYSIRLGERLEGICARKKRHPRKVGKPYATVPERPSQEKGGRLPLPGRRQWADLVGQRKLDVLLPDFQDLDGGLVFTLQVRDASVN